MHKFSQKTHTHKRTTTVQDKTITKSRKIYKNNNFRPKEIVVSDKPPLPGAGPDQGDELMAEEGKSSLVDTVDAVGGHCEPHHNNIPQVRVT